MQRENKDRIEDWCRTHSWNFILYMNIVGSEADVVIVIGRMSAYFMECFFRAKSKLIIVHR